LEDGVLDDTCFKQLVVVVVQIFPEFPDFLVFLAGPRRVARGWRSGEIEG
jgi:hypothetical protein